MSSADLRNELTYQVRSRNLLYCSLVTTALALMSSWNLVGRANTLHAQFLRTLADSAAQGITLETALAQPLSVREPQPGQVLIDNVLRFDFEASAAAVHHLGPMAFAINFLQFAGFVALPIVAFILGCSTLSRDARLGVLKARVVRVGPVRLHLVQVGGAALTALGALLVGVVVAMISGPAFRAAQLTVTDARVLEAPVAGVPLSELLVTLGLIGVATVFFTLVGAAFGLGLRQVLIPSLVFAVWNTAVPMIGPWDPRVPWASLAHRVFAFRGSFEMTAPYQLSVPIALLCIAALAIVLGGAATAVARRRSLFA